MSYTKYPNAYDDSDSLVIATDSVTPVEAEIVNRARDAIIAIESELGIQPSGTFSTVRARLDALENFLGSGGDVDTSLLTLQNVLLIGNITGGTDIVISNGDTLVNESGVDLLASSVENVAALRLLIGTLGRGVTLAGYYTSTDGGGGEFVWSNTAATDDGGTIFNAGGFGSSSAGWRRVYSGALSIKWFGAKGDGLTNDTTAIQTAVNNAIVNRKNCLVPKGHYRIASSINLTLDTDYDTTQFVLIGENATDDSFNAGGSGIHPNQSLIEWDSASKSNMIIAHGRSFRFENLTLRARSGRAVDAAIDIDAGDTSVGTRVICRNLLIHGDYGGGYGSVDYGIAIGRSGATNNLESNDIHECTILAVVEAGVYVASSTGQSKWNHIWRTLIAGVIGATVTKNCVRILSGSVVIDGACTFGYTSEAAVAFLGSPFDTISIDGLNSEGLYQLLTLGVTSAPCPVKITNCRFGLTDNLISAGTPGRFISYSGAGPIEISNTIWEYGGTFDPDDVHIFHASNVPARLVSRCNVYINADPIRSATGGGLFGLTYDTQGDCWLQSGTLTQIPSAFNVVTP